MKLGERYYYIKQNDKIVKSGLLVQYGVDQNSKYSVCYFKDGDKFERVEEALVFNSEERANKKLKRIIPIMERAEKINEANNVKMKAFRERIIGKKVYDL